MIDFSSISSVTFWLGTILPLVLILVGIILFIGGIFDLFKTRRLRKWPTVPGIVTRSELIKRHKGTFKPDVHYRYQVKGQIYESRKFFHGQESMSYSSMTAQEKIAPYPVGKTIQVHYHPQNPANSVVEIKTLFKYYLGGALGLIIGGLIFAANFWAIELFAKP